MANEGGKLTKIFNWKIAVTNEPSPKALPCDDCALYSISL